MCDWKDGGIMGALFSMFESEPERVKAPRVNKKYTPDMLHTFTVEKPFCCPPDQIIMAALHPVGIPIFNMKSWVESTAIETMAKRMKIEVKTFENLKFGPLAPGFLPMAFRATFSVPKTRANHAEYLLLSTQRLIVINGSVNAKNEKWAAQRNGRMPRASDPARGEAYALRAQAENGKLSSPRQPAYESTCDQAKELWAQVDKLAKEHQAAKGPRKVEQGKRQYKRKKDTGFWYW